jgi:hypothetical protein
MDQGWKTRTVRGCAPARARDGGYQESRQLYARSGGASQRKAHVDAMSIDAEEAAIRTVILGALRGDPEGGERNFDALSAMRQVETIVKALKVCGYEIRKISR